MVGGLGAKSVAAAGDVNGDGISDFMIGTGGSDSLVYVVFGTSCGFPAQFDLSTLDGSNGFVIKGKANSDAGVSVNSAGDVNGDGIDDMIVGADFAGVNATGAAYVIFGSKNGFPAKLSVNDLNGTNGFRIDGADADNGAGISVSGAGDLNGDGVDDMLIGAWLADSHADDNRGAAYVVFG